MNGNPNGRGGLFVFTIFTPVIVETEDGSGLPARSRTLVVQLVSVA